MTMAGIRNSTNLYQSRSLSRAHSGCGHLYNLLPGHRSRPESPDFGVQMISWDFLVGILCTGDSSCSGEYTYAKIIYLYSKHNLKFDRSSNSVYYQKLKSMIFSKSDFKFC